METETDAAKMILSNQIDWSETIWQAFAASTYARARAALPNVSLPEMPTLNLGPLIDTQDRVSAQVRVSAQKLEREVHEMIGGFRRDAIGRIIVEDGLARMGRHGAGAHLEDALQNAMSWTQDAIQRGANNLQSADLQSWHARSQPPPWHSRPSIVTWASGLKPSALSRRPDLRARFSGLVSEAEASRVLQTVSTKSADLLGSVQQSVKALPEHVQQSVKSLPEHAGVLHSDLVESVGALTHRARELIASTNVNDKDGGAVATGENTPCHTRTLSLSLPLSREAQWAARPSVATWNTSGRLPLSSCHFQVQHQDPPHPYHVRQEGGGGRGAAAAAAAASVPPQGESFFMLAPDLGLMSVTNRGASIGREALAELQAAVAVLPQVCVCMCVNARARARVCVCLRVRLRAG